MKPSKVVWTVVVLGVLWSHVGSGSGRAEAQFISPQAGLVARSSIVHRGAPLLFNFRCNTCSDPMEDAEAVVVRVQERSPLDEAEDIEGTLELLVPTSANYLRWVPARPLEEGEYVAHLRGGPGFVATEINFTVGGEIDDAPILQNNWRLTSGGLVREGTPATNCSVSCLAACAPGPNGSTQQRQRVAVRNEPTSWASKELAGDYLFRIVIPGTHDELDDRRWLSIGIPGAPARLFDDLRSEYCVELQALRVRDLEVLSLETTCVPNDTFQNLDIEPARFDRNCKVDGTFEGYLSAWCHDNEALCRGPKAAEYEGCKDFANYCPLSNDASPQGDDADAAVQDVGTASGCSIHPVSSGGAHSTLVLSTALIAWLRRRRLRSTR